ncbi:MAG: DsrE family protein [Desulfobacterales bacterium]|nr:DsrE family protein [Desulfobacterales bacterium]
MNKVCVLIRVGPYGMAASGEGFRVIIGLASFGVETSVILLDDGVFVAIKGQNPSLIEMQSIEKAYDSLGDFGAKLYIYRGSMEERGISETEIIDAELIDEDNLKTMLNNTDAVITFT